jgi:hypothetical protein
MKMPMQQYIARLVGNHYRQDGKAALPLLPEGQPLILEPEPTNPFDPDAVKVLVDMTDSKYRNMGFASVIHLGYVPRSRGTNFGANQVLSIISQPNWEADLTFDMKGEPLVRITIGADNE